MSFSKDEYFLTLRFDEVNLRQGPSKKYPVKIFYKKKYLPVLILDQFDVCSEFFIHFFDLRSHKPRKKLGTDQLNLNDLRSGF